MRTYIVSEEADSARIEFFSESTGKSIYSKALNDLRVGETEVGNTAPVAAAQTGLNGYAGLGEAQVNDMVDRKVSEHRRNDEFQRLNKEVDELRNKNSELATKNEELEANVKAKSDIEFYSGIVGAAFPGLATLFTGTPLAQAAGILSGTSALNGTEALSDEPANEDSISITEMVSEFCRTLNAQEASAIHLLFMAFEKDRSMIQKTLHYITATTPNQQAGSAVQAQSA